MCQKIKPTCFKVPNSEGQTVLLLPPMWDWNNNRSGVAGGRGLKDRAEASGADVFPPVSGEEWVNDVYLL